MRVRHKLPAVVTAMNLNGLGVARSLGRHGVEVTGIHGNARDPETETRHLRQLWLREPGPESLLGLLREKGRGFADRPVLLPVTDESVALVANHLDELRGLYRIAMPEADLVLRLLDKEGIRAAAEELGFAIPRTFPVDSEEGLRTVAADVVLPCILKPAAKSERYARAGHAKAYLIESRDELLATYRKVAGEAPRVVVQQYIPGGDEEIYFTLQYRDEENRTVASFTGRKLRQWRPHCGGTSSCQPAEVARLDEKTSSFFGRLHMTGLCSIEYKRDPRDGGYYMLEPTVCRTDWQNAVADNNGVPLAYLAYCDLAGAPAPTWRRTRLDWRWVHLAADRAAAAHHRGQGELGRLAWLWSIRWPVRGAYLALDDPGPWISVARAFLRRRRAGRPA